jgi:hypothetical protein
MSKNSLALVLQTSKMKNIDMHTKISIKSEGMTPFGGTFLYNGPI